MSVLNTAPVFRFTLTHLTFGSLVITEPDGWSNCKLKLERHEDYHSLVEYFEGEFIFYGENNFDNGGADWIRQVENIYGLDAEIQILIEADINGDGTYEEQIFSGQLDLTGLQEMKDNKIKVPIIRNDFWAKFIARRDTPVDLLSSTDLDGDAVSTIDSVTVNLPSQKVRSTFRRSTGFVNNPTEPATFYNETVGVTSYLLFDNSQNDLDEIDRRFEYGTQITTVDPRDEFKYIILATYSGDYSIDCQIRFYCVLSVARDITVKWYLSYGPQGNLTTTQIGVTKAALATNVLDDTGPFVDINTTVALNKGDVIYIYGEVTLSGGTDLYYTPDYYNATYTSDVYTDLEIVAATRFADSSATGYLLHDAANAIIDRIIGRANTLYSLHLGSTLTNGRAYGSAGCGWNYALTPGLQIRGYTFTEKVFSMSFKKWWEGADPIFNLGLGYDTISGTEVIRIEDKAFFYDATSVSVNIPYIRAISRMYDESLIFNQIEIGYNKWESENISALDDPQAKRWYATRIQKIKNTLHLYSDFIAASLGIEITRRQTIEKSKDYKFDNDIFIIALNETAVDTDVYTPELDENFSAIVNLNDSDTRYNSYLTPAYNLLRWQNVPNGCLTKYPLSVYKFVKGEGNYDMGSDTTNTCHGLNSVGLIYENQDIDIISTAIKIPMLYEVEIINFTWSDYRTVRENRHKAIGLSVTDRDYRRFFIKEMIYEPTKGKAKITCWPYDEAAAQLMTYYNSSAFLDQASNMPIRDYELFLNPYGCSGDLRLTEDGAIRLTEDGQCRLLEDITVFYLAEFLNGALNGWASEGTDIPASTLEVLLGWDNAGTGNDTWTLGDPAVISLFNDAPIGEPIYSDYLRGSMTSIVGLTYEISYNWDIFGSPPHSGAVDIVLLDNSNNVLDSETIPFSSNGTKTGTVTLSPSGSNGTYVALRASNNSHLNTKTFTVNSVTLSGGTGSVPVALPSWAYSGVLGGSAAVTTIYEDYGVKNFVLTGTTLPQQSHTIEIQYAATTNNSNASFRLKIKDGGGAVLHNAIFASAIPDGSQKTASISITDSAVWTTAAKFEILMESSDFDNGDQFVITQFKIYY